MKINVKTPQYSSESCAGALPRRGRAFSLILAVLAVLASPSAFAANVNLKAGDASGTSSFTGATNWSNGTIPSAGNNYFTGVFGMRSPGDANNYTFGGDSLTLQSPTTTSYSFLEKATASVTYTINNFTNNGGIIRSGGGRTLKLTITGNQFVIAANSAIWADQNGWIINSPLAGSGDVTNRTDGNANDTIAYGGNNSAWTGRLRVASTAGTAVLILNNANATPGNPATVMADQISLGGTTGCWLVDNVGASITNLNGGVTLAAATMITNSSGITTVISEPITGGFALTKAGAGTLILSGANSYTGGTVINGGVLNVQNSSALGASGTVNEAGGNRNAGIQLQGNVSLPSGVNFITSNDGIGTVPSAIDNVSGNNTINGSITMTSGGGNTIIQSDSGALTLAGPISIAAGISARALVLQGASTGANTISGVISNGNAGAASLILNGPGNWTLSGNNTYTGNTTINAGTLALSGSGSISNSANINIAAGAILDVSRVTAGFTLNAGQTISNSTGTVNGSVTTAAGSMISPDTAGTTGTLTLNNNLGMGAGGAIFLGVSGSATSGNDQIVVGGNLTLSSSDTIHINAMTGGSPLDETADYVLFAVSGTTTMPTIPTLAWDGTLPANSGNYSIKKSGNNVVLRYSAGTPPTVAASASPDPSARNQAVTITANVTPGTASIANVKADVTAIGGSATASLVQDSSQLPSLVYTNTFIVAASTLPGTANVSVVATDTSSPTPLTGTYILTLSINASGVTWNGGGADDNWSSNANWAGGLAPGISGDNVTFAGATRLTPNMNASYSLTGLTFDGTAGAFILGTANGTLTNGSSGIANNSTSTETLNIPVTMSAAQTFTAAAGNLVLNSNINNGGTLLTVDGAANTAISGGIFGAGGLTKVGNGILTLTGSNSFTGSLFVKAGTNVIDSGGYMNTVGSYCSIGQSGSDVGALILRGTGTFTNNADFNVGDIDSSTGILNLEGSAKMTIARLFVGSANASGSTAQGTINQTGGSLVQTDGGIGTFAVGGRTSTSGVGVYNISGGTLTAVGGIRVGGAGTGTFNVSGTAAVNANGGFNMARLTGSTGTLNLDGGTVTTLNITSSTGINATNNFNGATVRPTTANTWISALTQCNVRNGGAILDTTNLTVTVSQPLAHSVIDGDNAIDGGLSKFGPGKLILSGTNTYTGLTLVNNGTLELDGSLTSSADVKSGATLGGIGAIGGTVTNETGGTVSPGNGIGTLTVTGNLTLKAGSTNTFEVNGSTPTNDVVALGGNVTYGGLLNITATGSFTAGQQFQLFTGAGAVAAGNFAAIAGSPGAGLRFSFTNGVLSVLTAGPTVPEHLTNSYNAGVLSLSWPAGEGWRLQMQTNSLTAGLGTNWIYLTDGSISSTNITVDATKPTAFYRLAYP